jgi:hypothetical protein
VRFSTSKKLTKWCDLFLSIVHDPHIPKCSSRNVYDHPWIDKELLELIKKKNKQRKKLLRTKHPDDLEKFRLIRRETKKLISKKKSDHANKLKESMFENPKRFWSLLKSSTKKIRAQILFEMDNPLRPTAASKQTYSTNFSTPFLALAT